MMYLYSSLLFVATLTVTRADYRCFCNYQLRASVYREPSNKSEVIGMLDEFDCRPAYLNDSSELWVAILYKHQVRYVAMDHSGRNPQTCPGQIPNSWKVPTSRTFKPSSRSTTSRSTKLTSAVTRICPTSQASNSDYECLCNYHNETAVYPVPSTSGGKLGYMYEFDCKPTYQMVKTSPGWQAIQYRKKVGYVALDYLSNVYLCPGQPSRHDLVTVPGCPTRSTASLSSITPSSQSRTLPTVLIPAVTTELPTYECLCTYHVQTAVHSMPAKSSGVIGFLYERRCKPMYPITATNPEWRSIHYEKQVGYVSMDGDMYISLCHGRPSIIDVVPNRVPSNKATIRVGFPTSSMSPFKLPSTAASSTTRSTLRLRSKPTVKSSTSPVTEVSYQITSTEVSRTTALTSIKPSLDLSTTTSSTSSEVSRTTASSSPKPSEVSRTTAHTSPTPTNSLPTTVKLIRSETVSAPDVDVFRQNTSSSSRAVTGASTVSSSVEQSPKKCLNDPQHISDGFGKGTVAGMTLVAFLVGLLGGALAVSGFLKLRARAARKYEVLFENGSTDLKAVIHVK